MTSSSISPSLPPRTALIGRDQELARLTEALLQEDVRLVTISGPGGVGKTRVAVAVGGELEEDHADGHLFIPLESLTHRTRTYCANRS